MHFPSSTSNTISDGNNLNAHKYEKQPPPLSIRFLTARHTLLSIHCSIVPCSHPLRIVVSMILGSDFLHPVQPTIPTFYFASTTLIVHQSMTAVSSTRRYPSSPFSCSLCMGDYPDPCPLFIFPSGIVVATIPMSRTRNREQN